MTMRKLSYFAALVVAMTAVSCAQEIDAPVADGAVKFTASFDADATKAVLKPGADESKVEWEAGDQVSVFAEGANYLFAAQTPGASTTLSAETSGCPANVQYYAVYPYDADAAISEGVITTELPVDQIAVLGSFSTHLAVAKAVGYDFAFKNVCGLVKVKVTSDNVTKIVLEGNSGEVVAGAVNVTLADAPSWTPAAGQGSTSVSLVDASGTLAVGDYYFAVLPQTFAAGFKVTAYKGESASVIRNVTSEVTIARADIVTGKAFGIDGKGTEAEPYILKTAQDVVDMRSLAVPAGETWFKMANDIDMTGVTKYTPVNFNGKYDRKVHFDGNNKTMTNFSPSQFVAEDQVSTAPYASLFGVLYGSCKNLTVKDSKLETTASSVGFIGGYIGTNGLPGYVENVHVVNCEITGASYLAAIGGQSREAVIKDCTVDVKISATGTDCAGVVGRSGVSVEIDNVVANVEIATAASIGKQMRYGGIIGYSTGAEMAVTNCDATISVEHSQGDTQTFGGICGYAGADNCVISKCSSNVQLSGGKVASAGGVVGVASNAVGLTLDNCCSAGSLVSRQVCGGILARLEKGVTVIRNCYSTVSVEGLQGGLGGVLGVCSTTASVCQLQIYDSFAWNDKIVAHRDEENRYASGAMIGSANCMVTVSGCKRNPKMIFLDPYRTLTLHDDCVSAFLEGSDYQQVHDAKPLMEPLNDFAKKAGWDETIWDLSGELPVLK